MRLVKLSYNGKNEERRADCSLGITPIGWLRVNSRCETLCM